MRGLLSAFLTAAWILAHPVPALGSDVADAQATEKRLKQLEQRMQSLRKELNQSRDEQGRLQARLGETERRIGRLIRDIERLQGSIDQSQRRLSELTRRERELAADLNGQKEQLARLIRAAHAMGHDHALKLLFSLDSAERTGRLMTYYQYFNEAQVKVIERHRQLLGELQRTRLETATENQRLRERHAELAQQRQALDQERQQQKNTLAALRQTIRTNEETLRKLTQDQQRLQKLLEEIEEVISAIPPPPMPEDSRSFAEMRAKLSWPIHGKLLHRFGAQTDSQGIKWNGIFIRGDAGTPVKAVHAGRVVFADWLRGFGLLVIIDHGQGYMSLYGSNQALYKQPGDKVRAGDVIASVGHSGGQSESGLYFEVRHKGEPQDPLKWLATP